MAELEGFELNMIADELKRDISVRKPHVVILGAGASRAALPHGDKNGKKLPLMCDLVETIELGSELDKHGIDYESRNFEDIYSDLYEDERYKSLVEVINTRVWGYFSNLELPSYPTIYDHLVLSLREKDLIATFNWDPFLYYACWRNHRRVRLPHAVYLHGNVAIGYCLDDKRKGKVGTTCSRCGKKFVPSGLLFPIRRKNYTKDPFIECEWEFLKLNLKHAYMLTIFGYGAPQSDIEAIEPMKDAWGDRYERNLEQTEIIDVKNPEMLRDLWKDFIHTHHYDTTDSFYNSSIALFPRRTCEAQWNSTMECRFLEQNPIPRNMGFEPLWEWYNPLVQAEE